VNSLREAALEAERIISLRRNEGNPAYEKQAQECLRVLREVLAAEPAQPVAWMHPDGRVVTANTMECALRDGGAMRSSLIDYTIPLYTADAIREAVEAEREACAKLAENTVCDVHLPTGIRIYGHVAARAIRARGAA